MGLASADDVPPTAEEAGAAPKLDEVLDDLAMRFVVNCPAEEQESFERLLFQVEAAFWFYEDQYREIWPHAFPVLTLLTFAQRMFKSCPMLSSFEAKTKEIYDAFMSYKLQIPTCGAMLLNHNCTKLLLVKGWKGNSWGFPKGKIDKDEDKETCAAREVLEEVGYDVSEQLDPKVYIETKWKDTLIRLYIVAGVPEDFQFATRTKKEISEIAWHKLKELPTSKEEKDGSKNRFWMVVPFVTKLKRFLAEQEKQKKKLKGQKQPPPKQPTPPAQQQPSAHAQQPAAAPAADRAGGKAKPHAPAAEAVPPVGAGALSHFHSSLDSPT